MLQVQLRQVLVDKGLYIVQLVLASRMTQSAAHHQTVSMTPDTLSTHIQLESS